MFIKYSLCPFSTIEKISVENKEKTKHQNIIVRNHPVLNMIINTCIDTQFLILFIL